MNTDRLGMVLGAIAALNEAGSPSTRTHIQKLLYFAETWGVVRAAHEFVLHLHGPYAFDLDRDIAELETFGHVVSQPNPGGYGARYSTSDSKLAAKLRGLAKWLGPKATRELEALATC